MQLLDPAPKHLVVSMFFSIRQAFCLSPGVGLLATLSTYSGLVKNKGMYYRWIITGILSPPSSLATSQAPGRDVLHLGAGKH